MVAFSSLRFNNMAIATSLLFSTVFAAPSSYTGSTALNKRQQVNSFAGTSNYFIAGLSAGDRSNYLSALKNAGSNVIRIWVAGASGNDKGNQLARTVPEFEGGTVGQYNYNALEYLDEVLVDVHNHGMKVILALHDGNRFGSFGSCDAYCYKYGGIQGNDKKNSPTALSYYQNSGPDFDNRINAILNYQSPGFGKPWSQLSEVIMAIDVENEPFVQAVHYAAYSLDQASQWLCDRAQMIKSVLGGSQIAVATGGIAGSLYANGNDMRFLNWDGHYLSCPAIDIFSIHAYIGTDSWDDALSNALSAVRNAGKLVMVEEWGVKPPHNDFVNQASKINSHGVPWLYWEIIPGQDDDSDYEMTLTGGQANNIPNMIHQAANTQIASGLEGFGKYLQTSSSSGPSTSTNPPPPPPPPTCDTTTCNFAGHCFGTSCGNDNDCTDQLTCNSGTCGCAPQ